MSRTQTAAIKAAKAWVGKAYPAGWCQAWVVAEIFQTGGVGDYDRNGRASALDGWKAAKRRVETTNADSIPAGYPVYWSGGKDGHAAVSAGNGYIYTTDLPTTGKVGKVKASEVTKRWGYKLLGYVITEGNGHTMTDPSKAVPWFSVRFLNVKGDDDEGARTFASRLPTMVTDLVKGKPDVIGVCELRAAQQPSLTKALAAHGYKLAGSGGRMALYVTTASAVGYHGFYPYPTQGQGAIEGILRVRAKVNGHWDHFGVTHLDYRIKPGYDQLRVQQAKEGIWAMRRFGLRYGLPTLSRRVVMGDMNSDAWVHTRAFKAYKYADVFELGATVRNASEASFLSANKVVKGARIDRIETGASRPVLEAWQTTTKSDHRIQAAIIGKKG